MRVLLPGVVIFGVTVPEEVYLESLQRSHVSVLTSVMISLLITGVSTIGDVVYPGVLERLIGDARHGRDRPVREVLRSIPYGRLLLADVVVSLAILFGLALFVVPGLAAFTLLCLVGALINLEDLSVPEALRRSARLVRTRLLLVFVVVTIPFACFEELTSVVEDRAHLMPLGAELVVVTVASIVVGTIMGLLVLALAFELTAREKQDARRPAPAGGAPAWRS
jgi:hypothetical protein